MDLDFCPNNENILITSCTNEITYWDIRNYKQPLFTYECTDLNQAQFYKDGSSELIVS